jgi:hypothetical protein
MGMHRELKGGAAGHVRARIKERMFNGNTPAYWMLRFRGA